MAARQKINHLFLLNTFQASLSGTARACRRPTLRRAGQGEPQLFHCLRNLILLTHHVHLASHTKDSQAQKSTPDPSPEQEGDIFFHV